MRADYAAGRRKPAPGISPRERALWPLLREAGWVWRLSWIDVDGAFELDFAQPDRSLNVELDGIEHRQARRAPRDAERDACLQRKGWRILRIPNEEVDASPEAVARSIASWVRSVR